MVDPIFGFYYRVFTSRDFPLRFLILNEFDICSEITWITPHYVPNKGNFLCLKISFVLFTSKTVLRLAIELAGLGEGHLSKHRRLPSSDCAHWHSRPNVTQSQTSETMFQPTRSRAVARNSKWWRSNDRARRYERGEDPAVWRNAAEAPVTVEHGRLPSSDCTHWHSRPDGTPLQAIETMFQPTTAIVFHYPTLVYRPSNKGTKLLLKVIKAIIIIRG